METLYGKTPEELAAVCAGEGMPRFAARQIARWLYRRHEERPEAMTDLAAAHRVRLAARFAPALSAPVRVDVSADGTRKYLFRTPEGDFIESAYIPDGERATLCVSSQAGCRMGCRFCATGRQGLSRSLTAAAILNQIVSLPERDRLTNVVFMGMGEPLDNLDEVLRALSVLTSEWGFGWSPTRITVSTAGVLPALPRFLAETKVHLAVSLHNPFGDERAEIMPVERAWPVADVAALLRRYDFTRQRRVSFEYILLSGMNDSPRHVRELCRLLNGIRCRINIIRFHKIPGSPYFSPPEEQIVRFRDALTARGIQTTIRASRGEDIRAACGLLSTEQRGE
ncbi:23S rRNA (adenine(2503)-C(2))-methyltransferase RlmN [uncultured Alistipes sp.]|uniref:23S rRNA (adenine(2503)-C(2))-methyltransferase RlmN n=1 Tax=uncultured Alistipes sp. TaxID=538949 RepID=UPI000ED1324C|nr:23S rRNA (adenine(2503)-C(2))-methyltransferase RlmN [uncultured Alistipes sp.]HCN14394.1 23S rRNA (adenine(2503)-C(2))-methyltransferase RlmN [Alistipes sp.]